MHFVSENAGRILVRSQEDIFSQDSGKKIKTLPTIWLRLKRGTAPEWAVAQALEAGIKFEKRPRPGSTGGADIPVATWAAYIDTQEWAAAGGHDDEIRARAEQLLMAHAEMIEVHPPVLAPPWPNYDELVVAGARTAEKVAARNLETAEMVGVSIDDLVYYEEMTHKREAILAVYREALEAARPASEPPSYLVEA